jgi:Transcriptional Coactivator p15 (PC4)
MSNASDLRNRAEQLRQQLPERRTATPPQENGKRIGTIERSADEEIRVNWSEFEGKPFVSLRLWKRGDDGQWWPDGKRGMSVRIRELPDLAAAIAEALDIAEANQHQWRESQANRPPAAMPGRRVMDPATLPPANGSGSFDEFSEDHR